MYNADTKQYSPEPDELHARVVWWTPSLTRTVPGKPWDEAIVREWTRRFPTLTEARQWAVEYFGLSPQEDDLLRRTGRLPMFLENHPYPRLIVQWTSQTEDDSDA